MPARSGGAGAMRRPSGGEDWSDHSTDGLSPKRQQPDSSPNNASTSSIGEDDTDVRKNFIDATADRARANLRSLAADHAPRVNNAAATTAAAPVPASRQTDNNTLPAPANARNEPWRYPQPAHQPLPNAETSSNPQVVQRRIDIYNSFSTAVAALDRQLPPENPSNFEPELHTHFTIKNVPTAVCDECKGKGTEIYKCETCVKQICQPCVERLLDKELKGRETIGERKAKGLPQIDVDEFLFQWQGKYRHSGFKLCYGSRKAAGVKGDFKIDIHRRFLVPSETDDFKNVTIYMSRDVEEEGKGKGKKRPLTVSDSEPASPRGTPSGHASRKKARKEDVGRERDQRRDKDKGKKRARTISDSEDASEGNTLAPRAVRKKVRKDPTPQPTTRDEPNPSQALRRAIHGKKAALQLQSIAAAAEKALREPRREATLEVDTNIQRRSLSRPPPLDLSAARPSPTLPQANRNITTQRGPLPQPPFMYQSVFPAQPTNQGQMGRPPPQRQQGANYAVPYAPYGQAFYQPQGQGMRYNDSLQVPQQPQGQTMRNFNPYLEPVHQYQPPGQYMPHLNPYPPPVRQPDPSHQWGPAPPRTTAQQTTDRAPQPEAQKYYAPPLDTRMTVQISPGVWRSMTFAEYQQFIRVQQQQEAPQQRPAPEPTFEPRNVIRRGEDENINRIPLPTGNPPPQPAAAATAAAPPPPGRQARATPRPRRNENIASAVPFPLADRSPALTATHQGREVAMLPFTGPYRNRQVEGQPAMGALDDYQRLFPVEAILHVVNERWSRVPEINGTIPEANPIREFSPVAVVDEEPKAVKAAASEEVKEPVKTERNEGVPAPNDDADATTAKKEETPTVVEPAEEDEPLPNRHSSAPPYDFHPAREFNTPPSVRQQGNFPAVQHNGPERIPSSPPVPVSTRGQGGDSSVQTPAQDTEDGAANPSDSEADTEILSPAINARGTVEEPILPPIPLPPTVEPPSTPTRQITSDAATPSTANRTLPGGIRPQRPPYYGAHHSPNRAEEAISTEQLDRHRRSLMRAMLDAVPEARALGLAPSGISAIPPVPPKRFRKPTKLEAQAVKSNPSQTAGANTPGNSRMEGRRDQNVTEPDQDTEDDDDFLAQDEGYNMRPGGSSARRSVIQRGVRQPARRTGLGRSPATAPPVGMFSVPQSPTGRSPGMPRATGGRPRQRALKDMAEQSTGKKGKGKAVASSRKKEVHNQDFADDNVEEPETDPIPGLLTDDVNQDEDFTLGNNEDVEDEEDEPERTRRSSTRSRTTQPRRPRARATPSANDRAARQSSTTSHRTQSRATDRRANAPPRSVASGTRRAGSVQSNQQEDIADNTDGIDEFGQESSDNEGEPVTVQPTTPTRRTRSGREYVGESGWVLQDYLDDVKERGEQEGSPKL